MHFSSGVESLRMHCSCATKGMLGPLQALALGHEVAQVYAEAITLLRRLENSPIDPAALVGLDAAGLYSLSKV